MTIVLRRPRTRQPQGAALLRADVIAAQSGNSSYLRSGARVPSVLGTTMSRYGVSNDYTGAGNGSIYFSGQQIPTAAGLTLIAIAQPTSTSGVEHEETVLALSSASSGNSWFRIECRNDLGGGVPVWNLQAGSPVSANVSSGVSLSAGRPDVLIAVWRPGTGEKSIWVNGLKRASDTTDWGTPSPDQFDTGLLQRNANPVHYFTGQIPLAAALRVASNDTECAEISSSAERAFARIFAPIRIVMPAVSTVSVPSITAVSAENITSTSADYRVTLDFA